MSARTVSARISQNSATLIDHLYYYAGINSKKDINIYSSNIFSDLSDHLPNFIILSNSRNQKESNQRPLIRLYSEKNKSAFQQSFALVDWQTTLYSCQDVNTCYSRFLSVP